MNPQIGVTTSNITPYDGVASRRRRRRRRRRRETFVCLLEPVSVVRRPHTLTRFFREVRDGTSRATRARILSLFALASFYARRAAARTRVRARVASRIESKIILIFSTADGWMDGWMDGRMDRTRSVRGTRALSRDERRFLISLVRSVGVRAARPPVRPSVGLKTRLKIEKCQSHAFRFKRLV